MVGWYNYYSGYIYYVMIKNENLASKISGNVFYVLLSVHLAAVFYWKSGYSTCASVIEHVNVNVPRSR